MALPADVFISYSTPDRPIADAICKRMESARIGCWIAPRNVRPGHNFADEIIDGIAKAKILAVVISGAANASRHVLNEVATALDMGRAVIPFRVEAHGLTGALSYHLGQLHWLDATIPPIERHIDDLIETVSRYDPSSGSFPLRNLSQQKLLDIVSDRNPRLPSFFEKLRLLVSPRRRLFHKTIRPLHQRTEPVCRAYLEMFYALRRNLQSAVSESDLKAVVDAFYETRSKVVAERAKILPWYRPWFDQKGHDFGCGHLVRLEHLGNTRDDLLFLAASIMNFFFLMPSKEYWSDSVVSRAGHAIYLLRSLSSREIWPSTWEEYSLVERRDLVVAEIDCHVTELETYWEAHCAAYAQLAARFE